jgi:hypothetical protein
MRTGFDGLRIGPTINFCEHRNERVSYDWWCSNWFSYTTWVYYKNKYSYDHVIEMDFQPEFTEFLKVKVVSIPSLKCTLWPSFGTPEVLSGFSV